MRLSCLVSVCPVWLSHLTAAYSVYNLLYTAATRFIIISLSTTTHTCVIHMLLIKTVLKILIYPPTSRDLPSCELCVRYHHLHNYYNIPHIFYRLLVLCELDKPVTRYFIPLPEVCCAATVIVAITDPNSQSEMIYSCFDCYLEDHSDLFLNWNHHNSPANMEPCSELNSCEDELVAAFCECYPVSEPLIWIVVMGKRLSSGC